jgi:hypothetical protein
MLLLITAALLLGPPLSKPKIFFVVDIYDVLVQDPPLFGSTTGAFMVLLVHWFLSLTFMTSTYQLKMFSPSTDNTLRLSTLTFPSQ